MSGISPGYGVAVFCALALFAWCAPVTLAQSDPNPTPLSGHAQAEVENCLAMRGAHYPAGFCPTPTSVPPTLIPPTATPTPAAPKPTDTPALDPPTPEPTATDVPCWLTDPVIGDPETGIVYDGDGNPIPCDAAEPDDSAPADAPPDPTADATPTAVVIYVQVPAQAPPSPPKVIYQQAPTPEVVYVEVTPEPTDTPEPTAAPTTSPTVRPYVTATRAATSTATPSPSPTPAPTWTPEPTAVIAAASDNTAPPSAPSGWDILGKLGVGGILLALAALVVWALSAKDNAQGWK